MVVRLDLGTDVPLVDLVAEAGRLVLGSAHRRRRQPTGRSVFPGFIARSRANLEQAVTDPEKWANLWWDARTASPTA